MKIEKILSGIPIGGKTYVEGMEGELAEVLDAKQFDYLVEQGAIVRADKAVNSVLPAPKSAKSKK